MRFITLDTNNVIVSDNRVLFSAIDPVAPENAIAVPDTAPDDLCGRTFDRATKTIGPKPARQDPPLASSLTQAQMIEQIARKLGIVR